MNKRKLKFEDLEISGKRYKELCGFCEQYPEWKSQLYEFTALKAVQYNDNPKPANHNVADSTSQIVMRINSLRNKIDLIERCALMADESIAKYIIRSACYEESYEYLNCMGNLYIGRSAFYEKRRYFFYLLDLEKKKKDSEV